MFADRGDIILQHGPVGLPNCPLGVFPLTSSVLPTRVRLPRTEGNRPWPSITSSGEARKKNSARRLIGRHVPQLDMKKLAFSCGPDQKARKVEIMDRLGEPIVSAAACN